MDQITHLSAFFEKCVSQPVLRTSHISLYTLLHYYWQRNAFQNPLFVTRTDLMHKARIQSIVTYHKCIKDLHALGLIIYEPTFHPRRGSKVYMVALAGENANRES